MSGDQTSDDRVSIQIFGVSRDNYGIVTYIILEVLPTACKNTLYKYLYTHAQTLANTVYEREYNACMPYGQASEKIGTVF